MTGPFIVDGHLHLYRTVQEADVETAAYETWEYGELPSVQISNSSGDPAGALTALAEAGASAALVTNLLGVTRAGTDPKRDLLEFNSWLCDLSQRESAFVPFIGIAPTILPVNEAVRHIEDMAGNRGARGIKIHPVLHRWDLSDQATWPIFDACQRLGIGVVAHSGPSRGGIQHGDPDAYRGVLTAHPALRITLAHMGGASWTQLPGIARDFPQVQFDLSEIIAWLGAPKAPTPSELVGLIRQVGVERVMMGSDFPWYDIGDTVEQVVSLPGLGPAEQQAILGENAARFFGIAA